MQNMDMKILMSKYQILKQWFINKLLFTGT